MRDLNRIIVHCSYTPPSMNIGAETIRDWHVNGNGWSDIGYHYVIRRNGKVEQGRKIARAGAHVQGQNRDSIGICLIGGMTEDRSGSDCNFSKEQWLALASLIEEIEAKYGRLEIHGHREFDDNKDCPCFDVKAWRSEPGPQEA